MVPAWEAIGTLKPEFRGSGLRGRADCPCRRPRQLGELCPLPRGRARRLHAALDRDVEHRLRHQRHRRRALRGARHSDQRRHLRAPGGDLALLRRQGVRARRGRRCRTFRRPSRRSPTWSPAARSHSPRSAAHPGRCRARRCGGASSGRRRANAGGAGVARHALLCAHGLRATRRARRGATTSWSTGRSPGMA